MILKVVDREVVNGASHELGRDAGRLERGNRTREWSDG